SPQPFREELIFAGPVEATNKGFAEAKRIGLKTVLEHRESGKRWTCVVPASLYGPGDHFDEKTGHVIPSLIKKFLAAGRNGQPEVEVWGSGKPLREFLYIQDLASAIETLIDH